MSAIPSEERELLGVLDEIDSEISADRRDSGFDRDAEQWLNVRNGKSWRGPSGETPIFTANLAGNLIERKVASLSQSQPDLRVSSRNPAYAQTGRVLTDTISAVLAENDFTARIERAADFAAPLGHVGFNTAWDPYADYGNGDIIINVLDPRRMFVDRRVTDVTELHKAQYIRIDTPMPLSDIRRTWPGRGADVTSDDDLSTYNRSTNPSSWYGGPFKRPIQSASKVRGPYEWAVVREYWLRSDQQDGDGSLMFPAGRVIHRAGQIILDDAPNPYWDGGWPIDVWDWRVNADSIMGRSDIEDVLKLQESLNRLGHAIVKNVLLSSSITIIGDYNAMPPEEWKKLDNRAARILRKTPGRELTIVPPPPIPDQYLRLTELLARLMETLIGVPEAMQGKRQEGVVASSAVEGLMTAAETLVRSTARRLERVVERIGTKLISRVIQFYTSDRVMLTQGPTNEWKEYTFRRAELTQPIFGIDPETGLPLTDPAERDEALRRFFTQFRFKVTPLSSMPQNRVQRGLMAMGLFQAGLIDEEEVLRHVEWPNWKEILPRIQARKEQSTEKAIQLSLMGVDPAVVTGGGGSPPRANRRGTAMKMG